MRQKPELTLFLGAARAASTVFTVAFVLASVLVFQAPSAAAGARQLSVRSAPSGAVGGSSGSIVFFVSIGVVALIGGIVVWRGVRRRRP